MPALILIGVALWFWLGDPKTTVADWFWANDAAPWETVDAFYYPNRNDLTVHRAFRDLSSVAGCKSMVRNMATEYGDIPLIRGDYECGIGRGDGSTVPGITVYRATVK